MEINTILTLILIIVIIIGFISLIIWALSKNKKVAKFFKSIADGTGETLSHAGW